MCYNIAAISHTHLHFKLYYPDRGSVCACVRARVLRVELEVVGGCSTDCLESTIKDGSSVMIKTKGTMDTKNTFSSPK